MARGDVGALARLTRQGVYLPTFLRPYVTHESSSPSRISQIGDPRRDTPDYLTPGMAYVVLTTPLQRGRLSQLTHVGIVLRYRSCTRDRFIRLRIRSNCRRPGSPLCSVKAPISTGNAEMFVMNKNALARNIRFQVRLIAVAIYGGRKKVSSKLLMATLFVFRSIRSPHGDNENERLITKIFDSEKLSSSVFGVQ